MKNRFICLMMSLTVAFGLVACGAQPKDSLPNDTVQFVDEAAQDKLEDDVDLSVQDEGESSKQDEVDEIENKADDILSQMTLEEKVGQMFITRPENRGTIPVGGVCVFSENINSADGLRTLIENQNTSLKTAPFIAVDEEGGRVSRIANSGFFDVPKYTSMHDVGSDEDSQGAKIVGRNIGAYLAELGFNLDFAPVADVNTNPNNPVIGTRAFSDNPEVASAMVSSFIDGMHEENVMTTIKHFPGHGDTNADSHTGFVKTDKTWEELKACELIPYYDNLAKTDMVMAAHINTPNITDDERPASLSKAMIEGKLRGELGYDGVVITDSLEMGAITKTYSPVQVGIYAVNAGIDILLLPVNPAETYNAILDAVRTDEIPEAKIDESVLRILKLKLKYGVIKDWPNEVETEAFAVGAARTDEYIGLLKDKKVALLSNQTGMVGDKHTLDILVENGIDVTMILSPEHGFRGEATAGEKVSDSVDSVTGIRIKSLYGGGKVSASDMENVDVIVCDIQDVGVRFYTYYITMMDMMEEAVKYGKKFVVFDRPNPNGYLVDGPVLDMKYKSGVGRIPVAASHGLTMGEIALMANGEGWLNNGTCDLTVIPCSGYTHDMKYDLPIAPSPNLPNAHAVALYPSLCGFEGTSVSIGRGTDAPFECYGHPLIAGDFSFTPQSCKAAKNPPQEGKICYGVDLKGLSYDEIASKGFTLEYIIDAYNKLGSPSDFFGNGEFFDKLMGNSWVRTMILDGHSADEIKAAWQDELNEYKILREKYLIYQ